MKFLISDYDGTLKPFDENPNFIENYTFNKNIHEVNNFVKQGNLFMISTGRSTESIKKEIQKYKILYNYLSSYNGRVVLDKDNKLINAKYIDENFIKEINSIKENIKDIMLYNEFGKTIEKNNLIYIYITVDNLKICKEIIEKIEVKYPNIKISYNYLLKRMVIRTEFNKSLGIKKLLEKENISISKENIFTIGDESNDLEMLNDYNGYHVLLSNPNLYLNINNPISSVHKLIKKIK